MALVAGGRPLVRRGAAGLAAVAASLGLALAAAPASPTGAASKALALLADVVGGRDQPVVAEFDPQMHAALAAPALRTAWASYEAVFGRYRSHGQPRLVEVGSETVVRIALTMSRRPGEFRVTFDPQGQVAGLYFLRSGLPAPGAS